MDTPEAKAKLAVWSAKVTAFDPQKDLAERVQRFQERQAKLKAEGKEQPASAKAPTDVAPRPGAWT